MNHFSYFLIDILTVLFPIVWSFEKKMNFVQKWRFLIPGLIATAIFFLIWDGVFTYLGVWGFNPDYNLGINIINLPLEEVLFFICMPFASMFVYETVYFLWKGRIRAGILHQISIVITFFCLLFGMYHYDKWYTCVAFVGSGLLLGYHCSMKNSLDHEKFWVSYLIILIPFTLVNGILTGAITSEPIVWYNNTENLGIRFITIPIEDFAYNMLLLLMNVTFYEAGLKRLKVN
ncbi:MAG: lycopene cyclase domain-containing protein [Bacteroidota bacterium]|nr:lycopene cyclase domain-containing protein [Bacteroidota bacterium]